jgi:hypothetical protein
MKLVRIVAPDFVAGFETDGIVRRAAPIIAYVVGWTDDQVRDHVRAQGWQASILAGGTTRVIQHWESFEVQRDGKIKKFFFDTNAFRRGVTGHMSKEAARQDALAFAGLTEDQIEIDPEQAGPPPWTE